MLRFWTSFAAAVLVVSLIAHGMTFVGIDSMAAIPGVMLIHVLIFPPFIAAIIYANVVGTGEKSTRQQQVTKFAPRWLRTLCMIFFAYAFVNFGLFIYLIGGARAHRAGDRYVMKKHGKFLREIGEKEFHQHQTYVVRGFSGHWMLFSTAALMLLWGAGSMRKHIAATKEAASSARAHC